MNVENGTEAAQFLEKEYINGIFLAVWDKEGKDCLPGHSVDEGPEEGGGVNVEQGQGLPYSLT